MGWDNIFHCEIEEFPRKILNHYWPGAISYEDITKTDFSIHRGQIDILTGGFPCQPYSQAGKRLGKEDERHLWPEMLRAVREVEPTWVVGENVSGISSWNGGVVFNEVQADLENEGYIVQPVVLPAAAVGAPHRRDRVWFVAYSGDQPGRGAKGCESLRERELLPGEQQGGSVRREGSRCSSKRIITYSGLQRQKKRQEQPTGAVELCEERKAPNGSDQRRQEQHDATETA